MRLCCTHCTLYRLQVDPGIVQATAASSVSMSWAVFIDMLVHALPLFGSFQTTADCKPNSQGGTMPLLTTISQRWHHEEPVKTEAPTYLTPSQSYLYVLHHQFQGVLSCVHHRRAAAVSRPGGGATVCLEAQHHLRIHLESAEHHRALVSQPGAPGRFSLFGVLWVITAFPVAPPHPAHSNRKDENTIDLSYVWGLGVYGAR